MPHFHNSERFKPPEIRKNLLNRVLGKSEETNVEVESESSKVELPEIQSGIEEEDVSTMKNHSATFLLNVNFRRKRP